MIHAEASPYQRTKLRVKEGVKHAQVPNLQEAEFLVEDWWDRVIGKSWMDCKGNPACLVYAMRTGMSDRPVPTDDEVLYGKIGLFGHLFHVSELIFPETK